MSISRASFAARGEAKVLADAAKHERGDFSLGSERYNTAPFLGLFLGLIVGLSSFQTASSWALSLACTLEGGVPGSVRPVSNRRKLSTLTSSPLESRNGRTYEVCHAEAGTDADMCLHIHLDVGI